MNYPWPEEFRISANDECELNDGLGDRGRDLCSYFPNRQERHRFRNGLEEEIWILRRYLLTLSKNGLIEYPLKLRNSESPDFFGSLKELVYGIEVTVATTTDDQKAMTFHSRNSSIENPETCLVGYYGGRFKGGASGDAPERALSGDVLAGVERKAEKTNRGVYETTDRLDLVLYGNSNATDLIFMNEKKCKKMVRDNFETISTRVDEVANKSNISKVSVIIDNFLFFDLGGQMKEFELRS